MPTNFAIKKFQHDLLYWFERNLRDLPWRKDKDPYKVWVSEIMLQQTRVDTVIPYFQRFMERFPTIADLAAAEEEEVLKLWEGLGYYSRARNLHAGVREVHEKYGGKVPDSSEEMKAIRGVGPYTAGAVLSIAYGKPEPAVDGNVLRVLSRILHVEEDIQKAKTRKYMEQAVRELIAQENPSFFNQALMELGALICTPRSPKCAICPVSAHCRALELGEQEQLPIKGKAKPPKEVEMSVAFLAYENKFFIRQRPSKGLLAGLWELPNQEGEVDSLVHYLTAEYGIGLVEYKHYLNHQHTFSHLQWNMKVYYIKVEAIPKELNGHWVSFSEYKQFTFPVSFQKIIGKFEEEFNNGKT